ncbi:hypothetical protein TTHERM_00664040 (macronuclear) [Tetrahymena thermophila SB210]|uniref:Uncharacterized protein n=1 Tax=Tetrahymena thermophila (strain SB210) TaxID=312017 RepID=I7MKS2_TETTS|nr:hypothetical protein TTHERM_00664040 [Tetrahymena thermophila SB210]EAR99925.2 hypothetical protein TTHERM_00664040 [Tetrahymena thermophila SB210]|eukprot:XP_001020170.2 hypothetical protein TTHERM_00664040 [Tetrahymena thermophila SB210]
MGNTKSNSKNCQGQENFKEEKIDASSQVQNINSNNEKNNVQNDIKVNVDSSDLQCISYLHDKISNLTNQITSLSFKNTLQTKDLFPIDNILSIFQQFTKLFRFAIKQ